MKTAKDVKREARGLFWDICEELSRRGHILDVSYQLDDINTVSLRTLDRQIFDLKVAPVRGQSYYAVKWTGYTRRRSTHIDRWDNGEVQSLVQDVEKDLSAKIKFLESVKLVYADSMKRQNNVKAVEQKFDLVGGLVLGAKNDYVVLNLHLPLDEAFTVMSALFESPTSAPIMERFKKGK